MQHTFDDRGRAIKISIGHRHSLLDPRVLICLTVNINLRDIFITCNVLLCIKIRLAFAGNCRKVYYRRIGLEYIIASSTWAAVMRLVLSRTRSLLMKSFACGDTPAPCQHRKCNDMVLFIHKTTNSTICLARAI